MRRDDDGQIAVLTIGLAVVALALVFVVVSVSALYLDRKTLQSAADMMAADAASQLSQTYFEDPNGEVRLTNPEVADAAARYLAAHGASIGIAGASVTAPTGSPDGRTAVVTLTRRADVILIPSLVNLPRFVQLTVTAQARAGE
ncbi:MAG: hypothetical protein L0G23_02930 [Ruaniaceae bacterium]|nr:hypothetical protein [Ruaniaceae bacterium]